MRNCPPYRGTSLLRSCPLLGPFWLSGLFGRTEREPRGSRSFFPPRVRLHQVHCAACSTQSLSRHTDSQPQLWFRSYPRLGHTSNPTPQPSLVFCVCAPSAPLSTRRREDAPAPPTPSVGAYAMQPDSDSSFAVTLAPDLPCACSWKKLAACNRTRLHLHLLARAASSSAAPPRARARSLAAKFSFRTFGSPALVEGLGFLHSRAVMGTPYSWPAGCTK